MLLTVYLHTDSRLFLSVTLETMRKSEPEEKKNLLDAFKENETLPLVVLLLPRFSRSRTRSRTRSGWFLRFWDQHKSARVVINSGSEQLQCSGL